MALLGQIVTGSQSGRSGADNGHLITGGRQLLTFLAPEAVVMLPGESLQGPDGNRLVNLAPVTLILAGMSTNEAADRREGNSLSDYG